LSISVSVRQSEIPVLVITEGAKDFKIEKFILATDTEIDNKKKRY